MYGYQEDGQQRRGYVDRPAASASELGAGPPPCPPPPSQQLPDDDGTLYPDAAFPAANLPYGTPPTSSSSFQPSGLAMPAPLDDAVAEYAYWGGPSTLSTAKQVEQPHHQHQGSGSYPPPPSTYHQPYPVDHDPYPQYQPLPTPLGSLPSPSTGGATAVPSASAFAYSPHTGAPHDLGSSSDDFRVAFANLQRKQVELRLAEEHRRSREAELEILRLRELERQRSASQGSLYASSTRSSYSSVGAAAAPSAGYVLSHQAPAFLAHPASHLETVAASTPSSTGSVLHGLPPVEEHGHPGAATYAAYPPAPPLAHSLAYRQSSFPSDQGVPRPRAQSFGQQQDAARDGQPSGYPQPQAQRFTQPDYSALPPPPPSDSQPQPLFAYHPQGPTPPPAPLPQPLSSPASRPHYPPRNEEQTPSGYSTPFTQSDFSSTVPPVPPLPPQPIASSSRLPPARRKSPARIAPSAAPASSRTTPGGSGSVGPSKRKRLVLQKQPVACCSECAAPIAHLLLRGEEEHFKLEWEGVWVCKRCMGEDTAQEEIARRRKRTRDTQDLDAPLDCDVCLKKKGRGGIVAKDSRRPILFSTEFVCVSCEAAYARCTDCGGGGGGRIGIGKWRCKQLFTGGRKTCSLTHTRISNAPLVFGVWDSRDIRNASVRASLLEKCEALWRDRLLSRLAIPEVLECESTPPRTFAAIQGALDEGWPGRSALFDSPESPYDEKRRLFLGLTWCKAKPRRQAVGDSAVEDDSAQQEGGTDLLNKLNKVDVIPPGHELVGLFLGTWKMEDGTLLLTTSLPFESTDGDDRNALAIGEIACRVVDEIGEINQRRTAQHQSGLSSGPLVLLPPLEHLYVLCDNADALTRERMRDLLNRRRQFYVLNEYVRLHPHVDPALFKIEPDPVPNNRPGWIMGGITGEDECDVMVRWLGPDFGRQKLEEIAQSEFSKRLRAKKKTS